MNLIKIDGEIIDKQNIDNSNYNVEFLQKTHNSQMSEYIKNYSLIPKIRIDFIYAQCFNKNIQMRFVRYSKERYSLQFFIGTQKQNVIQIICPECGKVYRINQKNHLLRRTNLICRNCSLSFAQKNGGVENYKKSFKEKYGVTSPVYVKQFLEKAKKTCFRKYGVQFPLQKQEIRQKIKQTCFRKYGFQNPFQVPEIAKRAKNGVILFSNICCQCMQKIQKDLGIQILYGKNEKLFTFKDGWYRADGFIESKNFIIQFYGDYYHANPRFYKGNDVFDFFGKVFTAQQIWNKDILRQNKLIKQYGVKIFKIWQFDYKNDYENVLNNIRKELFDD